MTARGYCCCYLQHCSKTYHIAIGTLRSDDGIPPVTWGEWGEVAVVWREKLTLRSSGGWGDVDGFITSKSKALGAFGILVKVWDPLEIYVTFSLKVLITMIFPRTNSSSKNPDFPYDCYGSFDLDEMDDSECLAEFRFHKNDVPVLLEALQFPQSFTCHQGTIWNGIEALCITLRRFAYPCRYSDLIPRFGRPVPELSMISNLVMETTDLSRTQSQTNLVE